MVLVEAISASEKESDRDGQRRHPTHFATPINNKKVPNGASPSFPRTNSLKTPTDTAAPKAKGTTMPMNPILVLALKFLLNTLKSVSMPTMKRNKQRPRLATSERKGMEGEGKMREVKWGMRPVSQ